MTADELRQDIEERKEIYRDYLLNEARPTFEFAPYFIANNIPFNFTELVQPTLDNLDQEIDPDFFLLGLVRILFLTEEFNDEILEAIQSIRLWVTTGENLRIYWTENHQIMYSASAYLLRQKFGEDFFEPGFFDAELDDRLNWFLDTKKETRFFEANSPVYFQFTTAGLLLLHDFADDPIIRQKALDLIHINVEDWMKITNNQGTVVNAATRAFQFFYFQEANMFGNGSQQLLALLTGLGPLIVESASVRAVTIAFLLSDVDVTAAILTFQQEFSENRPVGVTVEESDGLFGQLADDQEKNLAQFTMGAIADPAYVNDAFSFISFYNLFANPSFEPLAVLFNTNSDAERIQLATVFQAIGRGTSWHIPELITFKNRNVMLTSMNDFLPGFKGYEQFPNMAVIGNTTVFTYSLPEPLFNNQQLGRTQSLGNNQIPYLKQKDNVLVAMYNPRPDLPAFGVTDVSVFFYMDASHYEEVLRVGDWFFGRLDGSFVGTYRPQCQSDIEDHLNTYCREVKQIYITVVGNVETHGNFDDFVQGISSSVPLEQVTDNCAAVLGSVDGQQFSEVFCQGEVDVIFPPTLSPTLRPTLRPTASPVETEPILDLDIEDIVVFIVFVIGIVLIILGLCFCVKCCLARRSKNSTAGQVVAVSGSSLAGGAPVIRKDIESML